METRKIVRGDRSGVFFGEIEKREGKEVTIVNARWLWWWEGAATLNQLAEEGVKLPKNCKFPIAAKRILILDAIQILDVSEKAGRSIDEVEVWKK